MTRILILAAALAAALAAVSPAAHAKGGHATASARPPALAHSGAPHVKASATYTHKVK